MAFVRFFLRVNYFMPAQCRGQAKSLTTSIAYKWPCKSMIWHFEVYGQGIFCLKDLTALIALVRLFYLPGNNKLWGCCKRDFTPEHIIRCCTRKVHFLSPVVLFIIFSEIWTVFEMVKVGSHWIRSCANVIKRVENGEMIAACKGHKLVVKNSSSCSIQVTFLTLSIQGVSLSLIKKCFVVWLIFNDFQLFTLFIHLCINQNKAIALISKSYKLLCFESFSCII